MCQYVLEYPLSTFEVHVLTFQTHIVRIIIHELQKLENYKMLFYNVEK